MCCQRKSIELCVLKSSYMRFTALFELGALPKKKIDNIDSNKVPAL